MDFADGACKIEHQGRTFEAQGAWRQGDRAGVYIAGNGNVTTWHGTVVGKVLSEKKSRRWIASTGTYMTYVRVRLIDGTTWHGRYNPFFQLVNLRKYK